MSIISSGLGARLEAKLDEAARRTQALADAVEESLVSSSSSTADVVAGAAGSASGLPFPTPLRSLVAQLLLSGGQQHQSSEQQEVESDLGPGEAGRSDRRLPPLLVEFKGAGLERGAC